MLLRWRQRAWCCQLEILQQPSGIARRSGLNRRGVLVIGLRLERRLAFSRRRCSNRLARGLTRRPPRRLGRMRGREIWRAFGRTVARALVRTFVRTLGLAFGCAVWAVQVRHGRIMRDAALRVQCG